MRNEFVETHLLTLVPQTLAEVRAMIDGMSPSDRAEVSPHWLALLDDPTAAKWTLGFAIVERGSGAAVGNCGFKGPPVDGMVEIAYGVSPEYGGRGYATEAAGGSGESCGRQRGGSRRAGSYSAGAECFRPAC